RWIPAPPPSSGSLDATSNPRKASVPATSSADAFTSTNSRSQDRTSFISFVERRTPNGERRTFPSVWELLEKPKIVLVEQSNVLDLIAQDRHPLDAHAPC